MLGNLKFGLYAVIALAVAAIFFTGNDSNSGATTAQLDRALGIASNTMNSFEDTPEVNESNVMEKFTSQYNDNLNSAQPPMNSNSIGVNAQEDGALLSFDDVNNNGIQDPGEKDLFKMEVDSENNRLIASSETEARDQGFSASGLLMGMLIGNMLSRQTATGNNPASRRATASGTASPNAKSRAGSGSHSRGK